MGVGGAPTLGSRAGLRALFAMFWGSIVAYARGSITCEGRIAPRCFADRRPGREC
jgi:hypothetical protein